MWVQVTRLHLQTAESHLMLPESGRCLGTVMGGDATRYMAGQPVRTTGTPMTCFMVGHQQESKSKVLTRE